MRDAVQPAVDFDVAVAAALVVSREHGERRHAPVAHARRWRQQRGVRRGARDGHKAVRSDAERAVCLHPRVVSHVVGGAPELRSEKQRDVLADAARRSETRRSDSTDGDPAPRAVRCDLVVAVLRRRAQAAVRANDLRVAQRRHCALSERAQRCDGVRIRAPIVARHLVHRGGSDDDVSVDALEDDDSFGKLRRHRLNDMLQRRRRIEIDRALRKDNKLAFPRNDRKYVRGSESNCEHDSRTR